MSSKYTRQIRTTVLEELSKDYVMGARARGVREVMIFYASVLKMAMLTIVTLLALSIGSLLGGTAIVETIFMWMALIYVLVNLITDILYHYLDPRISIVWGNEK